MSSDSAAVLVRRFYEDMWNLWSKDTGREILHPDLDFRGSIGLEVKGHDEFFDYMDIIRAAFPDFHNEIVTLVTEDDHVAARLTYTGTHRGALLGHAATGRKISYTGGAFFHIEACLIRRVWVLGDRLSLMTQIAE